MIARALYGGKGMRFLGIVLYCITLAGCGVAARVDARNDYQTSSANYKACLASNPSTPQNCEGLRLAIETDERKYNAFSAGLNPGSQSAGTVTVLNR